MNKIELPDCFKDIYMFEKFFLFEEKILHSDNAVLDFSNITFLEPYSLISLLLFCRKYFRNTSNKLSIINMKLPIYQYLSRMDFFKTNQVTTLQKIDPKKLYKRSSFSSKVVEIIEIPNKETESIAKISEIITIFRQRATNILKYWINDNITDYFVTVISEVCQNIFEHAMDSGFIAIQAYQFENEKIVRFVVSDSGVGIDGSFKRNKKQINCHGADLLKKVLEEPVSSKREYGYGLCRVSKITEQLNGSIFIRSNRSSVSQLTRKEDEARSYYFLKNNLPEFEGTQISITLKA